MRLTEQLDQKQRQKLLKYISAQNVNNYRQLTEKLGIRQKI